MSGRLTWLRVPPESELPPEVLELWAAPLEKLGFVPNVLRLYALRPNHLLAWNAHYDEVMKGDSALSKAEREMVAVVVSIANDCRYCIAAHSAALRKLTKDAALADQIAADHRAAAIPERMKAALDYAVKLTREPANMAETDVKRSAGRRMERRGRDGHRRGDGHVQHVEPHGLGPRLGAESRIRNARALAA